MKNKHQIPQNNAHRPEWNHVWMEFAQIIARRSYDPRYQVGAVVVSDDNTQVLAIGYNGNYKGGPNAAESLTPGESGMLHAEINALLKMDYNNPKSKILYVTLSPCRMCAKAIVNAGIQKVFYNEEYRDTSSLNILRDSGIEVSRFSLQHNT
jgi:dCMP deaminase